MIKKEFRDFVTSERGGTLLTLTLLGIITIIPGFLTSTGLFYYQENRGLFIYSRDYLLEFAAKPGGLLEYAGNFLTQVYNYRIAGVLLFSLLLILSWFVVRRMNTKMSEDAGNHPVVTLLPFFLLLFSQCGFNHYIHYTTGYLGAISFFLINDPGKGKRSRLLFPVMFASAFYLLGSFAFIYAGIFLMRIITIERGGSAYIIALVTAITCFGIFYLYRELFFLQPAGTLHVYPLLISGTGRLPLFLLLLALYTILSPWILKMFTHSDPERHFYEIFTVTGFLAALGIALILVSLQRSSPLSKSTALAENVARENWDEIIKTHQRSEKPDLTEQYCYHLALSNKDLLCEKLFFARKGFGVESLTLPRNDEYLDMSIPFYYSIGLISEAHHLAYESMVKYGYRPATIKTLVKTNLINGHYRVAERYLNVMDKTILYKEWARKYKEMLIDTSLIRSDADLGEKLRLLPKNDFFIRSDDDQNIELFVASNPGNRKAFEYKMARLLFQKDVVSIVYEIRKMYSMGYRSIPVHIEEAILQYQGTNGFVPDTGGLTVSSKTGLKFAEYNNTLEVNRYMDRSQLKNVMKKEWGQTYWYYYQFE